MSLRIVDSTSLSHVGRQRQTNEDSFFAAPPLFAVADGMGGARAGEVASRMAVEVFEEADGAGSSPEQMLERLAQEANRRIHDLAQRDESRAGMGCTLTAAYVGDGEITFGHVGDSRAYRLRGGKFEQLTNDHSLVEELVRQGKLTAAEAEVHPQRSIITRALGPEAQVEVDAFTCPAKPGDVYLLCSDGLTGMVSDERISEILSASESLEGAAGELIEAANANGGRDNITVVLFRLGEAGGDADGQDTLGDRATNVTLTAAEVRKAADEAERAGAQATRPTPVHPGTQTTKPTKVPEGDARDLTRVGNATLLLDRETADAERERAGRSRASPPAARPSSVRGRRALVVAVALLAVAAVLAGLYVGSRQFWFVGTNDRGLLTLYRGVPYELPLGLELYTEEYVSSVPAASITNARQRERILDQRLRERGDAVDLIRQRERALTGS